MGIHSFSDEQEHCPGINICQDCFADFRISPWNTEVKFSWCVQSILQLEFRLDSLWTDFLKNKVKIFQGTLKIIILEAFTARVSLNFGTNISKTDKHFS